MDELANMTDAELADHLSGLKADLEDAEEERDFVLGQTGLHVSAKQVQKYQSELQRLGERIAEVERALQSRGTAGA